MSGGEVVLCNCRNLCLKFLSDSFTIKESHFRHAQTVGQIHTLVFTEKLCNSVVLQTI